MCLAIPGKVLSDYEQGGMRMAKVQFGGSSAKLASSMFPKPR